MLNYGYPWFGVGARNSSKLIDRNQLIVFMRPSSIETFGSQKSFCFASVISGCLRTGSSYGSGFFMILDFDFVSFIISSASWSIVNS